MYGEEQEITTKELHLHVYLTTILAERYDHQAGYWDLHEAIRAMSSFGVGSLG